MQTSGSSEERAIETKGRRVEITEARLMAAYLETQYSYVQFLTEHLADCSATFNGDLAMVLILAVLGQQRINSVREPGSGQTPGLDRMAMSALRISDVAGIPRETVRRKLLALQKKGWVAHDPRHGWYIAGTSMETPVRMALSGLEARSFQRLARLHVQLSDILSRPAS